MLTFPVTWLRPPAEPPAPTAFPALATVSWTPLVPLPSGGALLGSLPVRGGERS